jgi:hypothetical protein
MTFKWSGGMWFHMSATPFFVAEDAAAFDAGEEQKAR